MTTQIPIDIFVTSKQWCQITPFAVTLGTGPTLQSVVVLARLDLDPETVLGDGWPDTLGNPVRVILPDLETKIWTIVFVDHFQWDRPNAKLRVWLAG